MAPSVAQAAVTQSSITAPADPYYSLWNEQVATPNVTISGTSNGTTGDAVDVRCYHDDGSTGTSQGLIAANVSVSGDGSFSTTVPLSALNNAGGGDCRLRAVPHSSTPTSGLGAYAGPRSLAAYYQLITAPAAVPNELIVTSNELGGQDQYDSLGGCGIDNTYLADPTTFGVTHVGPWACNDWADQVSQSNSSQGGIEIDGQPAYAPAGSEEINYSASGIPTLTVSVSINPTNGDLTIDETDPLVHCSGNPFPPTSGNCTTYVSAGVSVHRILTQTHSGHTITIDDSYSSTDGSSHTVSLRLENDQSLGTPANTAYEFPGQSSFSPGTSGEQVTASGGVPATIYIENTNYSEPSTSAVRAAMTYYQTPSGPFTFETGPNVYDFDALNAFTVPATGSVPIRYSYSYDYTLAAVRQEVAAAEDANDPPTVVITSPVSAATVTSSLVTVSGTASAGSGVSSVTVNGVAATLNGTTWSATVALTPGENTITVTVTSETGATSTTTETIDYSLPSATTPTPTPTPTPTTGGDGVELSTSALDTGVSVSGSGGLVLPLVCPQTASGCDADGILTLALSGSGAHTRLEYATAPIRDSVLARFAGVEIQAGYGRLVSVRLTPAATRYLQTRGVRRVRVALTINNHLSGGPDVTTTQLVWLNIAELRASCPAAAGTMTKSSIGLMRMGLTRSRAHRLGPHRKARYGFERYCLTSGAIRVAYTTKALLQLNPGVTGQQTGRVAIALTGNRHYSAHGVKALMTVAAAAKRMDLGQGLVIGKNTWYFAPTPTTTTVIKSRAGVIREIGIANPSLSQTASQQRILLRHL
jgi:hypothetical protein